jgi:hypothetical protein
MNHIYGVNKYTYARYCTEQIFFFKLPELDPDPELVMKFPDPDPTGSGSATLPLGMGGGGIPEADLIGSVVHPDPKLFAS